MRGSRMAFTVLWITLVVVVVVSGWIGVHLVGEALAPSAAPVLSDSQMDALLATAKPIVNPTDRPTHRPDNHPSEGADHHTSKPTAEPTDHATPRPSGQPSSTTSTTTKPTTPKEIRTFRSRGGSALVSCRGSQIALVAYSPAPGYRVEDRVVGPHEVEVKFEGDAGESTIRATCVSGVPVARIDTDD